MTNPVTLKRALGPIALILYGIGDILGTGIYALTGKVAGLAGDQAWLAFAGAMVVAALTACSYAEFSARHPHSGGAAYFLSRATRRPAIPLMIGWLVLCSGIVSMAAGSSAFAGYLTSLAPALPETVVIVLFIAIVGGIAFWGIEQSSLANVICTVVSLIGLLIVIVAGLAYIGGGGTPAGDVPVTNGESTSPFLWLGIASGAALAFYSFIGFEDLANVAEEVKEPRRHLPLAIIVAVVVTGGMYMVVARVATGVLSPAALGNSDAPLLDVVREAAPVVPPLLFSVIALFAVSNTALINCIMGSRLLYGLSRVGLLPAVLGTVHSRTQTPHFALLAVLTGVVVLAVTGTVQNLAGTTSSLLLLVFAAVHVGLLVVKWREPEHTGFSVPRAIPVLGLVSCLALVYFAQGASLKVGAGLFLAGVVLVAWRGGWRTTVEPLTGD